MEMNQIIVHQPIGESKNEILPRNNFLQPEALRDVMSEANRFSHPWPAVEWFHVGFEIESAGKIVMRRMAAGLEQYTEFFCNPAGATAEPIGFANHRYSHGLKPFMTFIDDDSPNPAQKQAHIDSLTT